MARAILLAQLARADELAGRRDRNARYLADALQSVPGIHPLRTDPRVTRHAWHLFIFRYQRESFGELPRERFLATLQAEGIPCAPGYVPLDRSPALLDGLSRLRAFREDVPPPRACPVADRLCTQEAVWLTQNMLLGSQQDMDDVVRAIAKIRRSVLK
jgi:dTDP-4-amino-4,6-dideoxygalactose transaminase